MIATDMAVVSLQTLVREEEGKVEKESRVTVKCTSGWKSGVTSSEVRVELKSRVDG